jgi:hypothetical protein
MVNLVQVISEQKGHMPEGHGDEGPLFKLTSDYRHERIPRQEVDDELIRISTILDSLPSEEVLQTILFMRSIHFIKSSDASPKRVLDAYKKAFKTGLKDKKDLEKRAEILRYLAANKSCSLEEVKQETQVREKSPLHYIDSLAYLHAPDNLVIQEIEKAKSRIPRTAITVRIPGLKKGYGQSSELVRYAEKFISSP